MVVILGIVLVLGQGLPVILLILGQDLRLLHFVGYALRGIRLLIPHDWFENSVLVNYWQLVEVGTLHGRLPNEVRMILVIGLVIVLVESVLLHGSH